MATAQNVEPGGCGYYSIIYIVTWLLDPSQNRRETSWQKSRVEIKKDGEKL